MKHLLAALAVLLLVLQPTFAQNDSLAEALRAIDSHEFSKAAQLLEPLARQGDKNAQYNLGMLYLWGQGVTKDERRAFELFTQASDQNEPGAQFQLGILYMMGTGTARDENRARKLIRQSAEQRYPPAEYQMGEIEDPFYWHRRGCEDGYTAGCYLLAEMYEHGWGTSPDPVEAAHWYYVTLTRTKDLSALLGIGSLAAAGQLPGADAQAGKEIAYAALSLMDHFRGYLVPSAQGLPGELLSELKTKMTPAELHAAEARLARATVGGIKRWTEWNGCTLVDMLMSSPDGGTKVIDDCTRMAAVGVPVAEYNLGWLNLTGYLTPQDSAAALKWLRLAADADFAAAQLVLGKELSTGQRLPKDPVAALGWFLVAEPRLTSAELDAIYHQDAVDGIKVLRAELRAPDQDRARTWADGWTAAHPLRHRPEVRDLSEEGIALVNKNDLKGAIEKFDAAIKADTNFAEPLFYRGRAMLQLKQTRQARADIEAGLAIEPGNKIGRVSLGDVKASEGDYAGAVTEFTGVLAEDPNFVYAIAKRGEANADLGDYAAAAKDVALLIKLQPSTAAINRPILAGHLFYAGRYKEAAAEYHAMAENPAAFGAVQFMISEYIATAHAGEDGTAELARNEARVVSHKWPYPVFGFYLGRIDAAALLRATADEWQKCEARYHIGEKALLEGDEEAANVWFNDVAKSCPYPIEPAWRSQWYSRRAATR